MDLSNVMVSTLMAQLGRHTNAELSEDQLRHMLLNVIRSLRMKFKDEYGELVICADNKNYWRKTIFPYYKAMRKEHREKSEIDWHTVFQCLNKLKAEIKDIFPYKVVEVEHAEADDVIAAICMEHGAILGGDKILILSSDKDMTQLQTYSNVQQFDPIRKKWVNRTNPVETLLEHIMTGDRGDGIPNILSPDDCIVLGTRQKPLSKKKIEEWKKNPDAMPAEVKRNFQRNKALIDFKEIPKSLTDEIISEFNNAPFNDRSKIFDYFIKNRLRNLMENIQDF